MGEFLAQAVPSFAGLRSQFLGGEGKHRLLLSATDAARAGRAVGLLERVCGPPAGQGTGIAFTLPVTALRGLAAEL
jgi:hypothetical protein